MAKISKGEYALAVYTIAHAIGNGREPNRQSLALAKRILDAGLQAEKVEMSGASLFSKMKKAVEVAAPFVPMASQASLALKATQALTDAKHKRTEKKENQDSGDAVDNVLALSGIGTEYQWITVGDCCSGDEYEAALQGGGAEMEALARRTNAIPDTLYKLAVLQQARKLVGGRQRPGARAMFAAKRRVDTALASQGFGVRIPGARPGRRTV